MGTYALIYWIKSKETSILKEENLYPNVDEGKITLAKYENAKKYKAKVIKKSYDKTYLESLRVSIEGELLPTNHQPTKDAIMKKLQLQKEKAVNDKKRAESLMIANLKLIHSPSIYNSSNLEKDDTDSSEDDDGLEEWRKKQRDRKMREQEKRRKELLEKDERERESSVDRRIIATTSAVPASEALKAQLSRSTGRSLFQLSSHSQISDFALQFSTDEEEGNQEPTNSKTCEKEKNEKQHKALRENEREQIQQELLEMEEEDRRGELELREQDERQRRETELLGEDDLDLGDNAGNVRNHEPGLQERARAMNRMPNRVAENQNGVEDPLYISSRPGEGRVQLCRVYNVWIDKAFLTYIQRWLESPKEMTRRLIKKLVGTDNLIEMCARGKSKVTRPVPKDIIDAVEYYVNSKCTHRLKPVEFTNVINMMCASLRNPRR